MKRRDFLSLGAGSAIAVMAPLPRLAMAAPVAQAPRHLYVWAVSMARAGNPISEKTLGMALKLPADQARGLMARLVSRGVVSAPNAAGVARAIRPGFTGAVASSPTPPIANKVARDVVDHVLDQANNPPVSGETEPDIVSETAKETETGPTEADPA